MKLNYKEYNVTIALSENIKQKTFLLQKYCYDNIGKNESLEEHACVFLGILRETITNQTNASPFISGDFEDEVERIINSTRTSKININGLGHLIQPSGLITIYASIVMNDRDNNLLNKLINSLNLVTVGPLVPIIKDVPEKLFNIVWPYFKKLNFSESFIPDLVTVNYKEIDETGVSWSYIEYPLSPLQKDFIPYLPTN